MRLRRRIIACISMLGLSAASYFFAIQPSRWHCFSDVTREPSNVRVWALVEGQIYFVTYRATQHYGQPDLRWLSDPYMRVGFPPTAESGFFGIGYTNRGTEMTAYVINLALYATLAGLLGVALLTSTGARLLVIARNAYAARRRFPRGCCPACGYDLRATPDRCPECGTQSVPAAVS